MNTIIILLQINKKHFFYLHIKMQNLRPDELIQNLKPDELMQNLTLDELMQIAKMRCIKNYKNMSKKELKQ